MIALRRSAFVLSLLSCSLAHAQSTRSYTVPREARDELVAVGADVAHGNPNEDYEAFLTDEQVAHLLALGVDPQRLEVPDSAAQQEGGGYSSYAQIRADFVTYAANHPAITQFHVLGTSVQGRDIFGLKISGNAAVEEDEPELLICGAIHGNEFASGEVPYLYALYLCDNYGVDPIVTAHVDAAEIWCIPLLNPDGYEAGTRQNANGVDLNRDFGFQWNGFGASPGANSQPETQALVDFLTESNATLTVTMHCSGDVLFYPWGFTSTGTSDATIIDQVGSVYSNLAAYPLINSWSDYETHGELLDHSYGAYGTPCYTAELSNVFNALPNTYARNEAALDGFCDLVGSGLRGTVTDGLTGAPLHATVWISGSTVPSYTDPVVGDVHRLTAAGTYDVTVWANGYLPKTVQGVVVGGLSQPATSFQVALDACAGSYAFQIPAINQLDPTNAYANTTAPSAVLGAPDGAACSLGSGGFVVLDLGAGHEIVDGPGPDFTLTEAVVPGDASAEKFNVYAGDAYTQTALIGNGQGTTSFDLAGTGLTAVRYLRVFDRSGAPAADPLAGMELDALTVLNGAATGNGYCSAKVNSLGCVPRVCGLGPASATSAQPAWVSATETLNQRNGLFFYGYGAAALPFFGGTLCVQPPLRRTGVQNSGGSAPPASDCSGIYAFDLNAWIQGGSDPLLTVGVTGYGQFWTRDPAQADGTGVGLTNAVAFVVQP